MSNEKTIDERISALPENVKELKLPEEGLPDEFKKYAGKPITEVLKSQMESQAQYTSAQQDKKNAERLVEELTNKSSQLEQTLAELQKKPEPEPEPIDTDEDYEYMTKADFKKAIAEINKPKDDDTKLTKEKVVEMVRLQNKVDRFMEDHPQLEEVDVSSLIQFGITKGAKDLNEAYKMYEDLATKIGLKKEGKSETVVLPNKLDGGEEMVQEDGSRFDRIINASKKSRMSNMITPVK